MCRRARRDDPRQAELELHLHCLLRAAHVVLLYQTINWVASDTGESFYATFDVGCIQSMWSLCDSHFVKSRSTESTENCDKPYILVVSKWAELVPSRAAKLAWQPVLRAWDLCKPRPCTRGSR